MSLYNIMKGYNPATFFLLPMLGKKAEDYPRFRDCFMQLKEYPEYNEHIIILTRTGGNNRTYHRADNDEMRKHPNYVTDFDAPFDNTYALWVFSVPEEFKQDYLNIKAGKPGYSDKYKEQCIAMFPKMQEVFDAETGAAAQKSSVEEE